MMMDFDIFKRLNRSKGKVLEKFFYGAVYFRDLKVEKFKHGWKIKRKGNA